MSRDCQTAQDRLALLLLEESDPEESAKVSAHLEGCAVCRAESERLFALFEDLSTPHVQDPGASYWNSFLPRLKHRIGREGAVAARPRLHGRAWAIAASVAIFILSGAVSFTWQPSIEGAPRMALKLLKARVSPDTFSRTLEETMPGSDLYEPVRAAGELKVPPPGELQRALDTVFPQDDSDVYGAASDLPPEARKLLLQALISDRV